jgi:hypothetical protein
MASTRQPLACDLRDQFAVRRYRPDTESAAVEIENDLILWRIGRRYPFAIDATGGDAFARHGCSAASECRIPIGAHLGHGRIAVPGPVDRTDACDRKIDRHRRDIVTCARHQPPNPMPPDTPMVSPVM